MKRSVWGVLIACCACGLSALGGCGKAVSAPSVGGETHWLEHCGTGQAESAFDCGPGLECVCGVCTVACTEDASCSGAGAGAVCAERVATAYADGCEREAPDRLCVASSDVVLVTAAVPKPVSINPNPVSGYCGAELFSTEVGCISCSEVRGILRAREAEIQSKYNACKTDEDCMVIVNSNHCDPTCGVAVNRDDLEAWERELGALGSAYCRAPARWPEHCGIPTPNCPDTVGVCDTSSGRCTTTEAPDLCKGRPADQCTDDDCSLASGRLYDAANQCFSAQSAVIRCVRRPFYCSDVPAAAVDAAGSCYALDDGCISDTFRIAPPEHPCAAALGRTCGM